MTYEPCEFTECPPCDMTGEDAVECGADGVYDENFEMVLCERHRKEMTI